MEPRSERLRLAEEPSSLKIDTDTGAFDKHTGGSARDQHPCTHRAPLSYSERPPLPPKPCMDLGSSIYRKGGEGCATSISESEQVAEEDKRVTVWNPTTGKKLSGNASPFRRNLHKYLAAHPDWEECPDAGETKKRRRPCSSSISQRSISQHQRSKLDDDRLNCPLYLWECLVAVAHAHSQNEEEWKGPIENIPSPRTPIQIPCRFTLSTAG